MSEVHCRDNRSTGHGSGYGQLGTGEGTKAHNNIGHFGFGTVLWVWDNSRIRGIY